MKSSVSRLDRWHARCFGRAHERSTLGSSRDGGGGSDIRAAGTQGPGPGAHSQGRGSGGRSLGVREGSRCVVRGQWPDRRSGRGARVQVVADGAAPGRRGRGAIATAEATELQQVPQIGGKATYTRNSYIAPVNLGFGGMNFQIPFLQNYYVAEATVEHQPVGLPVPLSHAGQGREARARGREDQPGLGDDRCRPGRAARLLRMDARPAQRARRAAPARPGPGDGRSDPGAGRGPAGVEGGPAARRVAGGRGRADPRSAQEPGLASRGAAAPADRRHGRRVPRARRRSAQGADRAAGLGPR